MGRYRAIMTDTDREYISNGESIDSHKRYQAISRVRNRITEELSTDVALLQKHHPDLLEELREVVCEDADELSIAASDLSEAEPGGDLESSETSEDTASEEQEIDHLLNETSESETTADGVEEVPSTAFDRDRIAGLDYNRDLTDPRLDALMEFLEWVKNRPGGVKKSAFIEDFWNEERKTATGYNDGSFWEAFAKFSMKRLDEFQKPNTRTYRYVGEADE